MYSFLLTCICCGDGACRMADHDRRRKIMRKQRSVRRESVHAIQEMEGQINFVEFKGEIDLHDLLSHIDQHLGLIARAA